LRDERKERSVLRKKIKKRSKLVKQPAKENVIDDYCDVSAEKASSLTKNGDKNRQVLENREKRKETDDELDRNDKGDDDEADDDNENKSDDDDDDDDDDGDEDINDNNLLGTQLVVYKDQSGTCNEKLDESVTVGSAVASKAGAAYVELKKKYKNCKKRLKDASKVIKHNEYKEIEGDFNFERCNDNQRKTIVKYSKEKLFPTVKMADKEIFDNLTIILENSFKHLQVTNLETQRALRASVCKEICYGLTQERKYVKECLNKVMTGTIAALFC
jgi:hypothetical protein